MDYAGLSKFIGKEMRMTNIYQPVMLKKLLQARDHTASVEEIAHAFLSKDIAQLEYYKAIVKRWPRSTLLGRGVVSYKRGRGGSFTLLCGDISEEQRQALMEMCDNRLAEFINKNPVIRRNRTREEQAINGSKRYDVIARSHGVCAACGARPPDARLDVDHIVPRMRGGGDEISNLQALCAPCNRQKRARDDTDFMLEHKRRQFSRHDCYICRSKPLIVNKLARAIIPEKPDTGNQLWIAPTTHIHTFGTLIPAQRNLCMQIVEEAKQHISSEIGAEKFNVSFVDADLGSHCYASVSPVV